MAEPLFRRSDGRASVVDLRVHSGLDFPKSHGAYWELGPVWDAIATAFTWKRLPLLTVAQARRLGFEARKAPASRDAGPSYRRSVIQIVFFSVYWSSASRPLSRPPKPDSL